MKYFKPKAGYAYNPLTKIPRNMKCPCDSGKKFKACHLPGMPTIIPADLARDYAEGMKSLSQVKFVDESHIEKGEVLESSIANV